jgi:hypothetical protein
MVAICLLSQPYIVVGAVVIISTVVVAVAIKEELQGLASTTVRGTARAPP